MKLVRDNGILFIRGLTRVSMLELNGCCMMRPTLFARFEFSSFFSYLLASKRERERERGRER